MFYSTFLSACPFCRCGICSIKPTRCVRCWHVWYRRRPYGHTCSHTPMSMIPSQCWHLLRCSSWKRLLFILSSAKWLSMRNSWYS